MKFLLAAVNAKYIHSNPALYSLRAYASKYSEHIEITEYTINNRMEDILSDLFRRKPDVIAFSCYIWNWNMIQELIVELDKIMPGVPIWLGGPEVTYDAEDVCMQFPSLTGVMIGEGEETFLELMEYYVDRQKELCGIDGIVYKGGRTAQRALTNLSSLPFLYDNLESFENRIIYYESSRGCPFRCSYCLSSIEKQVRLRDLEIVKRELQYFLDHQVKQVKFVDRTFNCNHKHAMEIWNYIKANDNGVTNFHFEISADILNEQEISLLNSLRPGLVQLEIGVQSTCPDTIEAINRTMDIERLKHVVDKIKSGINIHQHLDLIVGLPFETFHRFQESFNEVYGMGPEQLQMGFLKVLKGSLMYERAADYGIKYMSKPPYEVLCTTWISYGEILQLKRIEEMVELYYNSGQFSATIKVLEKVFESPFKMYEALAGFYEENNYFVNVPARSYKYELLLNFAVESDGLNEELYRELLTFDMYLRENMKSRPSFAKDLNEYRDEIKEFYMSEAKQWKHLKNYEVFDGRQLSKMTHMEVFSYNIQNISKTDSSNIYEKLAKPVKVLFDYKNRDPLNYEAACCII